MGEILFIAVVIYVFMTLNKVYKLEERCEELERRIEALEQNQ